MLRYGAAAAVAALVAFVVLAACSSTPAPRPEPVGYLDAATAQSPLEDGDATTVQPESMAGADLLVAIVMGDGPDMS